MKIVGVHAREIYDCRGLPTIECTITLENNDQVSASVPAGTSRGSAEAFELRDGGSRLFGMGVQKSVELIEKKIAPELMGKEINVVAVDAHLLEMDDTENKSHLGANTILAVSMATARAQAKIEEMPLFELIARLCNFDSVALPFPMFNLINGGLHADNHFAIQEMMVIPIGASSFHAAMEIGVALNQTLKTLLEKHGKSVAVGLEGGFAPQFTSVFEAFDLLMEAIEQVQRTNEATLMICLDMAANFFYNQQTKIYHLANQPLESDELVLWYQELCKNYPIYSIEDPMSEHDHNGWKALMEKFNNTVQIAGDDLFATNPEKIWHGIDNNLANATIIKPNQVGTITETLQAALLCREHGIYPIVSHRSGETNDSFIADLAVGISAGQIKIGGLSRGERMAKYNRLLAIEDYLVLDQQIKD